MLNFVAPGLGSLVNMVGNGYYGSGPMANWFASRRQPGLDRALSQVQSDMAAKIAATQGNNSEVTVGPVTRQQIGLPSNQYAAARPAMNMPTMPAVQAEAPWTGSLAQANPFGGQYGGNLGFSAAPQARGYGRAAGSFTPYGAGAIQVAGQGWAGSDAAAGFGLGAQGAGSSSAGSIALADAMRATKKNR